MASNRTIVVVGDIRYDYGAVRALLSGPTGEVATEIQRRARAVQRRAQTAAPFDTGVLRSSIQVNTRYPSEGAAADVVATAPHSVVVEVGRRRVEPVHKKWLRWSGKEGGEIFAKSSREVPGVHFMERSLDAAGEG